MKKLKILMVEDDIAYRELLCDALNLAGYIADGVSTVSSYSAWCSSHQYDLLIVDRQLPDGDGFDVVRMHQLNRTAPVVMLTALGGESDRIEGYENDVDLYLVKPISAQELIAAIENIQRKQSRVQQAQLPLWQLDTVRWMLVSPAGGMVKLSEREMEVMKLFADQPGVTISREVIAKKIGFDLQGDYSRRLEVAVRRLRNKVQEQLGNFPLKTIYGAGLVFNSPLSITQ
jgi:two-component system, OmpR family, response regulator